MGGDRCLGNPAHKLSICPFCWPCHLLAMHCPPPILRLASHACPVQEVVNDMIAKMEAAAEEDMEEHAKKRPALHKLRTLKEVEEFVVQVGHK